MRPLFLVFPVLLASIQCHAEDWVCPDPKDEHCDSYRAEFYAAQADKRLNEVYRKLLSDYPTKEGKQPTIIAQRAWLKYAEAHCAAVLSKFIGATFTMAEMEHSCRAEQINKRIKELESYCESCSSPNQSFKRDALKRAP